MYRFGLRSQLNPKAAQEPGHFLRQLRQVVAVTTTVAQVLGGLTACAVQHSYLGLTAGGALRHKYQQRLQRHRNRQAVGEHEVQLLGVDRRLIGGGIVAVGAQQGTGTHQPQQAEGALATTQQADPLQVLQLACGQRGQRQEYFFKRSLQQRHHARVEAGALPRAVRLLVAVRHQAINQLAQHDCTRPTVLQLAQQPDHSR